MLVDIHGVCPIDGLGLASLDRACPVPTSGCLGCLGIPKLLELMS
jgi:hypothetical protein